MTYLLRRTQRQPSTSLSRCRPGVGSGSTISSGASGRSRRQYSSGAGRGSYLRRHRSFGTHGPWRRSRLDSTALAVTWRDGLHLLHHPRCFSRRLVGRQRRRRAACAAHTPASISAGRCADPVGGRYCGNRLHTDVPAAFLAGRSLALDESVVQLRPRCDALYPRHPPSNAVVGASFPFALASAAAEGEDPARLSGEIYAANTAGAIIGALAFSLALIPSFGTRGSQQLLIALALASALVAIASHVWALGSHAQASRVKTALALAASLAVMVVVGWGLSSSIADVALGGRRIWASRCAHSARDRSVIRSEAGVRWGRH